MRLLEVRKPYLNGPDVLRFQRLAKARGVNPGELDGVFGPRSAAAAHTLKRTVFGYKGGTCHPIVGGLLMAYLEGKRKPTAAMLARAALRRRRDRKNREGRTPQARMRLRALHIIKGEVGTREQGENVIKYTKWWGWGPCAYCVIGIAWAWVLAGSKAFQRGRYWANTDAMLADAKAGRNGLHLLSDPLPGSPGVVDLDGGKADPDHGITFAGDNGDGTCETLEFNTVKEGTSIEGVWRRDRRLGSCWWFAVEH